MSFNTSLTRHQPTRPWTEEELRRKAAKLWHEDGVALINPKWVHNDLYRQDLINIAEKLFGKRSK